MQSALENNLVTPSEAKTLIERLEFMWRCSDILEWGRYYFPDKFYLPFCEEMHRYFIEIAEDPFTATLAPRGHAKTTIKCFLIPLFFALNKPNKFRHYLNVQSTASKAADVNRSIRYELENNEKLRSDYGDMVTAEKWTERQFVLKNGVVFSAIGAGQSVRGINYNNLRPDYIVGDDLYDDDCINSPENVRKINDWWKSSISNCVAVGKKVCQHVQGTAINREDLMHEKQRSARWRCKTFRAVIDWDKGIVLWKENKSIDDLRADRVDDGSIIFEREKQNELRDDATSIIKLSYIQRADNVPGDERIIATVGAIDPAEKTKELNDYTAKVGIYVTEHKNIYVFDAMQGKLTFAQNKTEVVAWHELRKFSTVPFETNKAFGLYEELKRTTQVPVRERITDKDKITRLIGVSHMFENMKVFFLNSIPEEHFREIVEQLIVNFPTHDDLRDGLVLAIEEAKRMRTAFVG